MAESIVSYFLTKLDTLVTEKGSLLLGVEGQFSVLEREFEFIRSFLRDAERKLRMSHLVEVWISQIRDVAYDAEDVIDEYILHLEQRKAMNVVSKMFYLWKKVVTLHRSGKKIQEINARVRRISTCRSDYNIDVIEDLEAADIPYLRRGIPTLEETEVVGFHVESAQIINLLKEMNQRRVISIIGMGGLGKTTLAQKIYKSYDVTGCFDVRVWITVSRDCQVRDILLSALKQVSGYKSSGSEANEELKDKLRMQLMDKIYLVVIDDIWKVEAWEQISGAFPSNGKARGVILTTRNKEVALHADPVRGNHIELRLLNEEESWELFCKKVFHMPVVACPPELVELGKGIVEKCGGLPLAILVIGGLLMGKRKTPDEWSKVAETISWFLSQDSNQCLRILTLSYSDLPFYLKPCFLYLGIFPEDTEIYVRRVIQLWVAEGFVEARGKTNMEAVAEDFLEELAQRSLIQVTERRYHGGPVLRFQVHDLLRDVALVESKKDKFMEICNKNNPSTSTARPRRLAIYSNTTEQEEFCTSTPPNLRCLFLFRHVMPTFSLRNKMLRVLDVRGEGTWKDVGNQVGNFILLQYLRIYDMHATFLPSSIGNLIRLQTLNVRFTSIRVLPKSIRKLKNLRHLFLPIHLRVLDVEGIGGTKDFGRDLLALQVSGPSWMNEYGTGLSKVFVRLTVLKVIGELTVNNCMDMNNSLPSTLTELLLINTLIEEDPSDALGSLPNLRILKLYNLAYKGREMVFCSGKFPQLQALTLIGMNNLCEWRVEDGSIPNLRHLQIEELKELRKLPSGLRNVTTLQKIEVIKMPQLEERIKENGEDWEIIKHIFYISYRTY